MTGGKGDAQGVLVEGLKDGPRRLFLGVAQGDDVFGGLTWGMQENTGARGVES